MFEGEVTKGDSNAIVKAVFFSLAYVNDGLCLL